MNQTNLVTITLLAILSFTTPSFAQNNNPEPMHNFHQMHQQHPPMPRPKFIEFPTSEELSMMTPPEPITEEMIKKRFAKQKARVEKAVAFDRKQAEKYAKDFARYQKYQADQLAKIMAKAEKQRQKMIDRVDEQEKRALENFKKRTESRKLEPQQY